jgi:hypothetical protein
MNTDDIDRNAYRRWWEAEGRGDLSLCPYGALAEDLVIEGTSVRLPAGHGLRPKHSHSESSMAPTRSVT